MKKRIINLIFGFLAISPNFAQAEYLVYQKSQQSVQAISSESQHAKIFDILMKYQAPMAFNSNTSLASELSHQEIGLLNRSEQKFLEEKLQKSVSADLQIVFIPTTLYEFFVVKTFAKQQYQYDFDSFYLAKETFPTKSTSEPNALRSFEKIIHAINNKDQLKKLHFFVNKKLVEKLAKMNAIPLTLALSHKILAKQIKKLQQYQDRKTQEFIDSLQKKASRLLLHKALELEYEAHGNNSFVIYRGSAGFDYKEDQNSLILDNISAPRNDSYEANSLCYGTTLLAAVFHDYYGACAHKYCAQDDNRAYALQINKNEYRNNGTASQVFYVPPYSTLSGLFKSGNIFHSRTRIDNNSTATLATNYFIEQLKQSLQEEENEKTRQHLLSELEGWELDAAYFSSMKSQLNLPELEKQFNLYLAQNIRFIKTKSSGKFRDKALERKLLAEHLVIAENPLSQ